MKSFKQHLEERKIPKESEVMGSFTHKDTNVRFEIYPLLPSDTWAKKEGATHQIHPFGKTYGTQIAGDYHIRYAKIKKTVVYVAVDEDHAGRPVWEKWKIKQFQWYVKESFQDNLSNKVEAQMFPTPIKAGLMKAFRGKRLKDGWFMISDPKVAKYLEKNFKHGCGSDGCKEIDIGFAVIQKVLHTGQFRIRA